MTVVAWVAGTILGLAAALALTRLVRGPTVLDRVIALDVLLSTIIGAIAVEAAVNRHGTSLPVLAVIALLGFLVGGIGLMLEPISWPVFWVGSALVVVAGIVFVVMDKMGLHSASH